MGHPDFRCGPPVLNVIDDHLYGPFRSSGCRVALLKDIVGWLDAFEAQIDFELSAMVRGVGEVRP